MKGIKCKKFKHNINPRLRRNFIAVSLNDLNEYVLHKEIPMESFQKVLNNSADDFLIL